MKSCLTSPLLLPLILFSCNSNEMQESSPKSKLQEAKENLSQKGRDLKLNAEQTSKALKAYMLSIKAQSAYDCSEDITDLIFAWAKDAENFAIDFFPMTEADEETLGDELHSELKKEMALIDTDPRRQRIRNILYKLEPYRARKAITYDIHLLSDEEVNAFSFAGGHIYVTTGLLNFVTSEDELAFVIGHEIAHVDDKHCVRKLQRIVKAQELLGESGALVANIGLLLTAPFGQIDEYEADKLGASFVDKAGYDPRQGLDFFTRLSANENEYSTIEKLTRTHPFSDQRKTCLDDYITNEL